MLIDECDELINAMKGADESHLNDLIRKINNLYNKLELENTNIPMTRLQALDALKNKAIMRRNRMRGNQLRLNADYNKRIEDAIKNRTIKKVNFQKRKMSTKKAHSDKGYESDTESETEEEGVKDKEENDNS